MPTTPPCSHLSNPTALLLILQFAATFLCHHPAIAGELGSLIQLPLQGGDGVDDYGESDDSRLGHRRIISVKDYGAVGNGFIDDTKAFKNAWYAACSSTSHKTVLKVPENHQYLVRPIRFTGPCSSNVSLRILGSILAPRNPFVWRKKNPQRWLYFYGINHLTLRGRGIGIINGMRKKWSAKSCKNQSVNLCRPSPVAVTFHRCRHLKVRNMTLLNGPSSHIVFTDCYHVKVSGLKVIAPAASTNTEGIQISGSHAVHVQNSEIATGDNCISVASGSSKVRIRNISCGPGHGISIGSLGEANSWAKVTDVRVDGAILSNTKSGLWIKTWQGGQGFASDILFQNVMMENVANPIIIDQFYCDNLEPCKNQTAAVKVNSVSFMNIRGTSATEHAVIFSCSNTVPCHNILLQDVQLTWASGGNATSRCWKASGFSYGQVEPPSCLMTEDFPIMQKVHSITALLFSAR
uniref:endo-polygalacturonase n=1 Tax=Anthurium amnicola TaxID=1678845 RepID=A0A1D1YEX9_9ARAE